MRRAIVTAVVLLAVLAASGPPVLAQKPEGPSTDMRIERKQQRPIVQPPANTGPGVGDAEATADKLDEQRRVEELRRKAMQPPPPPLDESTVEGMKARQLQEQQKR